MDLLRHAADMRARMARYETTVAKMGQRGERWETILRTCARLARKYATGMDSDGLLTSAERTEQVLACGAVLIAKARCYHPERPRGGDWWTGPTA